MTYILKSTRDPAEADYTPWGAVREFFFCKDPEAIISGGADTGKTLGALWKLHVCACKYPGCSLVIARKQLTDVYSTVLQAFLKKVLHIENVKDPSSYGTPVSPYGGEKLEWIDYPNGSRIWMAGLDKPGKVLSSEHDIIYVNQAEEASLDDWETLGTRTTGRAGNMPWSQLMGDCNPRAPTHWIKTRARSAVNPDGPLTLFESTHRDNPELFDPATGEMTEQGAIRLEALKRTTGVRHMRLFRGLWVAPEGAIYSMFLAEPDERGRQHVVDSFPIPPIWPRIVAVDPVGAHVAALWLAFDPGAGIFHAYREYREPFGLSTAEHARNILWLSGMAVKGQPTMHGRAVRPERPEPIMAWVGGGPSERQARTDWAAAGIPLLEPGTADVWSGIDKVIDLLNRFKLVIHASCPQLLSEIGEYERIRTKDGVATDKIKDKERYDCLDSLRYGLIWWTAPAEQVSVVDKSVPIGPRW